MNTLHRWLGVGLLACTVVACNPDKNPYLDTKRPEVIDPYGQLTREDYKTLAQPVNPALLMPRQAEPEVPQASDILVSPRPAQDKAEQLVSISVTEDVPLKDVFIELARLANVGLELDPNISGGVVFRAKNRPFEDVVQRVAALSGLRYEFLDGVLRVERDNPVYRNYKLDFLNVTRSGTGSVNVSTNVLSAGGGGGSSGGSGGGGGGIQTGSQANVNIQSESDVWDKFEESIQKILEVDDSLKAKESDGEEADAEAEEEVSSASADEEEAGAGEAKPYYVLSKEGGVLSVYATKTQHDRLQSYLEALQAKTSAQVLIEAKILEVSLNDAFQSGIEWNNLLFAQGQSFNFVIDGTIAGVPIPGNPNDFAGQGLVIRGRDKSALNGGDDALRSLIQFTEGFGTTRTLSSPRVNAMNNQPAIFTFARNEVYFEIDIQQQQDNTAAVNTQLLTVDSEVRTVPIGVMLSVMPSINLESEEITLHIRPTLSDLVGQKEDPAVAYLASQAGSAAATLTNQVPVVQVRELDTTMKVMSGDVLIIGGLMQNRVANEDVGVPGVQTLPFIGPLFKRQDRRKEVVETVIFMRATIVPGFGSGNVSEQDKHLYKKFSEDPRPLAF